MAHLVVTLTCPIGAVCVISMQLKIDSAMSNPRRPTISVLELFTRPLLQLSNSIAPANKVIKYLRIQLSFIQAKACVTSKTK